MRVVRLAVSLLLLSIPFDLALSQALASQPYLVLPGSLEPGKTEPKTIESGAVHGWNLSLEAGYIE